MSEDQAPPTPLPPAAQAPYPAHPAPHEALPEIPPTAEEVAPAAGAGLGPLGLTLIGGAVAALGVAIALPFLRRRKKAATPAKSGSAKPHRVRTPRKPKG